MDYENKEERSFCLQCGDPIAYGRHDRKFCCDVCKNKFNNLKAKGTKKVKMKILSNINRNYTILERLLRGGVTTIGVVELQQMGFKFDYVTSYQKIRRHDVFLCFDISFTVISDKVTAITKLSINLPPV